jgi:S-adenosylmethionine decarboxylase
MIKREIEVPEFSRVAIPSRPPPAIPERVGFMGRHLILDLWEAHELDNRDVIERALRDSVDAAEATLLHLHLHRFEPTGGFSGVAVLAESHISIHTWPERGYAALDVFVCGKCDPERTVPVLRRAFSPKFVVLSELRRGGGGASA